VNHLSALRLGRFLFCVDAESDGSEDSDEDPNEQGHDDGDGGHG
jgi:hypothetical protein